MNDPLFETSEYERHDLPFTTMSRRIHVPPEMRVHVDKYEDAVTGDLVLTATTRLPSRELNAEVSFDYYVPLNWLHMLVGSVRWIRRVMRLFGFEPKTLKRTQTKTVTWLSVFPRLPPVPNEQQFEYVTMRPTVK